MVINEKYMYIPIKKGEKEERFEFFLQRGVFLTKILEFVIPVANHVIEDDEIDYWAEIPVGMWFGNKIHIEGKNAEFLREKIQFDSKWDKEKINLKDNSCRPKHHFTPNVGWCNDPNGLIYSNGKYHFFYQYNPMNVSWENMSWGHAISKDLINWEEMDTTLVPDQDGTIFSGCGMVNERKLLGLPEDALVFFYSAAGDTNKWSKAKDFKQKIAYSVDGGKRLCKIEKPCIGVIEHDSRDPKVFWHEKTQAYIMTLWIIDDVFAIFRSTDLINWEETDRFSLKDGWECPDLFKVETEDGEEAWIFWTAAGIYYVGEFDGYKFTTDGAKHEAYIGKYPYAAQAFWGLKDRVVSIPWLRFENDGSNFTGYYGFPTDFLGIKEDGKIILKQKVAKEILDKTVSKGEMEGRDCSKASVIMTGELQIIQDMVSDFNICINGTDIRYSSKDEALMVGDDKLDIKITKGRIIICVDADLLELYLEDGERYGAFKVDSSEFSFDIIEGEITNFEKRYLL